MCRNVIFARRAVSFVFAIKARSLVQPQPVQLFFLAFPFLNAVCKQHFIGGNDTPPTLFTEMLFGWGYYYKANTAFTHLEAHGVTPPPFLYKADSMASMIK